MVARQMEAGPWLIPALILWGDELRAHSAVEEARAVYEECLHVGRQLGYMSACWHGALAGGVPVPAVAAHTRLPTNLLLWPFLTISDSSFRALLSFWNSRNSCAGVVFSFTAEILLQSA